MSKIGRRTFLTCAAAQAAFGGTPEDIGALARADSEKYARLVKELHIGAN